MKIREVIELFKEAGFEGRLFASIKDALKCEFSKERRFVRCTARDQWMNFEVCKRRVHFEACKWHRESEDPLCAKCRITFGAVHSSLDRADGGQKKEEEKWK